MLCAHTHRSRRHPASSLFPLVASYTRIMDPSVSTLVSFSAVPPPVTVMFIGNAGRRANLTQLRELFKLSGEASVMDICAVRDKPFCFVAATVCLCSVCPLRRYLGGGVFLHVYTVLYCWGGTYRTPSHESNRSLLPKIHISLKQKPKNKSELAARANHDHHQHTHEKTYTHTYIYIHTLHHYLFFLFCSYCFTHIACRSRNRRDGRSGHWTCR